MVRINRIYTRNGDDGSTQLVGGKRVPKDSLRVEAYGEVDELNSLLGMARTLAEKNQRHKLSAVLPRVQNELFDAGAELASPPDCPSQGLAMLEHSEVLALEHLIDGLNESQPELLSFVLPGGTELNSILHQARTCCRRAERTIVKLSHQEPVRKELLVYFNRLSDLLFAMARHESAQAGVPEYLWVPKKNRS